ncbi:hypothetical protein CIL05_00075 [Virgibacillus profundi]|uniref:Glycosyltransferase 2-like domain-containing protein n=1 Tax=Virgibacillus profundi TaxID=2024555 RepID=A0A2A2IJ19_9BACI|nr:glycosyltransferase family A protein [Virgibacillus profundi]PAV31093.1 hypothetical protein CIL05_00075 [Virgibacillus profundi]PXY55276.1 glycosyltransferase family 2 protein [Virgibacillus profundi]
MNNLITVFTPTYNRSNNLITCYQSLIEQTNKNFIWMIIDDGSTDETEEVVKKFNKENKINIEYIKKENGGKASAINLSLKKCQTELWVCLDSDDYLTLDAIEVIASKYEQIKGDPKKCGLLALRTDPSGEVMNNQKRIPPGIKYSTLQYIRYNLGIETEYAFVYKTEIIKKFPYPIINGEKFIPLSFIFDQIDLKYKYLIIQDDIMVSEYLEDGITRQKVSLIKKNPKGYSLHNKQRIQLAPNIILKIKAIILYGLGCILDQDSNALSCLNNSPAKILTVCLYPISYLIYIRKYKKV